MKCCRLGVSHLGGVPAPSPALLAGSSGILFAKRDVGQTPSPSSNVKNRRDKARSKRLGCQRHAYSKMKAFRAKNHIRMDAWALGSRLPLLTLAWLLHADTTLLKEHKNNFNKGVSALNYIQHQRIQFVAQAVPHQCIAHHGAEHRAAAAAEKTTASASPSRLWIQSCPG